MKMFLNSIAVFLVLFSSVVWAKADQVCISQTRTLQPEEINAADVSATLPEGQTLDPALPVIIKVEMRKCSQGEELQRADALGLPNIPDIPTEGDTRTVTQQRGCVVHTYTQLYKEGPWVTTTYNAVYLDSCEVSDV